MHWHYKRRRKVPYTYQTRGVNRRQKRVNHELPAEQFTGRGDARSEKNQIGMAHQSGCATHDRINRAHVSYRNPTHGSRVDDPGNPRSREERGPGEDKRHCIGRLREAAPGKDSSLRPAASGGRPVPALRCEALSIALRRSSRKKTTKN